MTNLFQCSKDKPKCEYCTAQGKECVYEDVPVPSATNGKVKKRTRKPRTKRNDKLTTTKPVTPPPEVEPTELSLPTDDVELLNFDDIPTVLDDYLYFRQSQGRLLSLTKHDFSNNAYLLTKIEQALFTSHGPDLISAHIDSPLNDFLMSMNSVQRQLGVSMYEFRLLHFFNVWSQKTLFQSRDKVQLELWTRVLPQLFNTKELVRKAVCSFLAIALLAQQYPQFLLDDNYSPSDSATKLFQFGMDSFGKLVEYILRGLARINLDEDVSLDELQALFLGQTMMFATLACLLRKLLPAVDFDTRNDVLSIARGLLATLHRCSNRLNTGVLSDIVTIVEETEILANTPLPLELKSPSPPSLPSEYPISQHLLQELENANYDAKTTATLRTAIRIFNFCIRQSIEFTSPVPFYRFLALCDDSFRELIYAKQPLALAFMAIISSIYLMTRNWFHRRLNIWVDYLEWYRWYQPVPYPWEIAMYHVVLDYEYTIDDYDDCITFDFNAKWDELFASNKPMPNPIPNSN